MPAVLARLFTALLDPPGEAARPQHRMPAQARPLRHGQRRLCRQARTGQAPPRAASHGLLASHQPHMIHEPLTVLCLQPGVLAPLHHRLDRHLRVVSLEPRQHALHKLPAGGSGSALAQEQAEQEGRGLQMPGHV